MTDVVVLDRAEAIATVTLNRPDKLNAVNLAMWRRLGEVLRGLASDDGVRCVVLRGAGDKAFGPGADIAEFPDERSNVAQAKAYGDAMHGAMAAVAECPHPVVAMIQGICVGGSLEVALMTDIRIAGESSRFGVPINRLGLVMAYPEIQALIAAVGPSTALEILFEGRVFAAAEALEKRLVHRVVPDDRVASETYATARRIAEGAPLVNRWHKKFVRRLTQAARLTDDELAEGFACFGTEDFRTGLRAFLDKKQPRFEGR